jgi:hypothetical protein
LSNLPDGSSLPACDELVRIAARLDHPGNVVTAFPLPGVNALEGELVVSHRISSGP